MLDPIVEAGKTNQSFFYRIHVEVVSIVTIAVITANIVGILQSDYKLELRKKNYRNSCFYHPSTNNIPFF